MPKCWILIHCICVSIVYLSKIIKYNAEYIMPEYNACLISNLVFINVQCSTLFKPEFAKDDEFGALLCLYLIFTNNLLLLLGEDAFF